MTKVWDQISPPSLGSLGPNFSDLYFTRPLRLPAVATQTLPVVDTLGILTRLHPYSLNLRSKLSWSRPQNFSPMSYSDNGLFLELARLQTVWISASTNQLRLSPTSCRFYLWMAPSLP